MAPNTETVPRAAKARKTKFVKVVTAEERKARAAMAKAFLSRYGDDALNAHHSCLERMAD